MNFSDLLVLGWGTLVLFVPGGSLMVVIGRVRPATAFAVSPAVTLGICYLAALLGAVTRLGFTVWTAIAVWVVLLVVAWGITRKSRRSRVRSPLGGVGPRRVPRAPRDPWSLLCGVAVLVAVAIGARTWLRGLGGLATIPQEHDIIIHAQLVARIMMTGQGAPWQSFPGDMLTGGSPGFYPNGFHLFAALVGAWGTDPVTALNGAMTVLFAVALPLGVAALALHLRPLRRAQMAAGAASLLSVVAYRPLVALMHDGGILSNAASFAIAPGTVALILTARRLGWRILLVVPLAVTGAVVLHPTSAPTVGITLLVWWAAELRSRSSRRRAPRELLLTTSAAVAAGILLVPFAVSAYTYASGVTAFPRDFSVTSLRDGVGITVAAPYGGFLDPTLSLSQTWLFALSVLGVGGCLAARRHAPVVVGYLVWAGVLLSFLTDEQNTVVRLINGIYYNSYVRITGGVALFQWLAAGIAIGFAVEVLVRLLRATGRSRPLRLVVAAGVLLALVVVVCVPYARVNSTAIAERYSAPTFVRTDEDDLAAARYVEDRIAPGQRVMNNANDGSTYGYVYYGLPIVVDATLGSPSEPATVDLLRAFDEFNTDPDIRDIVCSMDIAWAIADAEAPPIWAPTSRYPWVPSGSFSTAPGLRDLSEVRNAAAVARFGDVTVYRIDLQAVCDGSATG